MSMETWGQVPKEQNDSQLITEAIDAAIADHEADPEAHQGEGESLQNHKADEVIDHPAESIPTDKVIDYNITLEKLTTNKTYICLDWASIDSFVQNIPTGAQVYLTPGCMLINPANTLNQVCEIYNENDNEILDFNTKNPFLETVGRFLNIKNSDYAFGMGDYISDEFVGFRVYNQELQAVYDNGTRRTITITDIVLTDWHTYRIKITSGTIIEWFIDDVLVASTTTNLPTSTNPGYLFHFYTKCLNTSGLPMHMVLMRTTYYQDK